MIKYILGLMIISAFYGCSLKQQVKPRVIDTVIIKNSTGTYVKNVSISDQKGRSGSISSIPSGVEQIFGRGSKANRLPDTLHVRWTDADRTYHKSLSISSLLNSDSSNKRTIIIDLFIYGGIKAYRK